MSDDEPGAAIDRLLAEARARDGELIGALVVPRGRVPRVAGASVSIRYLTRH
jgi:hypothetical protein